MVELEDIDGVGPAYAEQLQDDGYESVTEVAAADPDDLDLFSTISGEALQENAEKLVDAEDVEATVDDTDGDDGPYTLEPGFSEDQEHHLMGALLEEEQSARKRNNKERLSQVCEAIADVRDGEPYSFSLDQLTIAYTALNQLESKYRGARGLSRFVGEIREMTQYFQEQRQAHWPGSN